MAELIPVLAFIGAGAAFWWLGRDTRAEIAAIAAAETTMDGDRYTGPAPVGVA